MVLPLAATGPIPGRERGREGTNATVERNDVGRPLSGRCADFPKMPEISATFRPRIEEEASF